MTEYRVFRLEYDQGDCNAQIDIGFIHKGEADVQYRILVWDDGAWASFIREPQFRRWREVNGVCEEAEPVFKAALPKAQALAILKG